MKLLFKTGWYERYLKMRSVCCKLETQNVAGSIQTSQSLSDNFVTDEALWKMFETANVRDQTKAHENRPSISLYSPDLSSAEAKVGSD